VNGRPTWKSLATNMTTATRAADHAPTPAGRVIGQLVLGAACLALVAVSVPVILRGAPLADDFNNCLAPRDQGLLDFMSESFERLGVIRPARFVEILLTTGVCQSLPFGVAIAAGLLMSFVVGFLLRRLLTMFDLRAPWPEIGASIWLLQPLGTEAALWPAALHVPLGLSAALGSLIAYRSGRPWMGALLAVAAMLSIEQSILALPLAAWLVSPANRRRMALITTTSVSVAIVAAFLLVPGNDPRLSADVVIRVQSLFTDVTFVARYFAVGVGGESIPLAVAWAFPLSVLVLSMGALVGWYCAGRMELPPPRLIQTWSTLSAIIVAVLMLLINAPVLLNQPRQGSPRIFAPTWLLLAAVMALWLGRSRLRQPRFVGALGGLYLSGAILSLALSCWVRVETADVVERISHEIAQRTIDGDLVTICEVPRAAVSPAPRGAFAVQDYLYDWAAVDALHYYTSRRATFRIHQADGDTTCPAGDAALVSSFDALRERND
jgi:hypothetical protein